jgi:hypothetical protein
MRRRLLGMFLSAVSTAGVMGREHARRRGGGFSANTRGTLKPNGGSPSVERTAFVGTGSSLHLVERFTRTDADTIVYEGTVNDSRAFTGPWTLTVPLRRDDNYEMFEYACHEGNYFIPNLLNGRRLEEAEAARGR